MAIVRSTAGRELTPEELAEMEAEIEAAGIIDPDRKPATAVSEE
jgi:hypothetical protein